MNWLEYFLQLVLFTFRIGALFVAAPLFSTHSISPALKFFFALALSSMLLPFQPHLPEAIWKENSVLILVLAREIGLGLMMGFSIRLIFVFITLTLEFMGLQIGFSIANMFDPQTNSQISVLAELGVYLSFILFFSTNLHHEMIYALIKTYQKFPIGLPDWDLKPMLAGILYLLQEIFEAAVRLSFPVVVSMWIIHLILGVVSRTSPQMNLFFNITFILNIVSGLLLINLYWPQILSHTQTMSIKLFRNAYYL